MRVRYDQQADALYIRFNRNRYAESDPVKDDVIIDYDRAKRVIGIEILNASRILPKKARAQLKP